MKLFSLLFLFLSISAQSACFKQAQEAAESMARISGFSIQNSVPDFKGKEFVEKLNLIVRKYEVKVIAAQNFFIYNVETDDNCFLISTNLIEFN
jgi:hypothetical protein